MRQHQLDAPLFRCVAAHHGATWAPIDRMRSAARWNREGQGTIYAAFDSETAKEEKLRHLEGSMVDAIGVAQAMWTTRTPTIVRFPLVIVSFDALATSPSAIFDGMAGPEPLVYFAPYMLPGPPDGAPDGYAASQHEGSRLADAGITRLIVTSYPYFAHGVLRWTNVLYVGGRLQPSWDRLPQLALVGDPWDELRSGRD